MKRLTLTNPFSSGRILREPNLFASRESIVLKGYNFLITGRNIFIGGERGVGKSSLSAQIRNLIIGDPFAFDRFGIEFSNISYRTVGIRCDGSESLDVFCQEIIKSVDEEFGKTNQKIVKIVEKYTLNFHVLSAEYSEESTDKLTPRLIGELTSFFKDIFDCESSMSEQRLYIFIDEIDLVTDNFEVGKFFKVLIEDLQDSGDLPVYFTLIGITQGLIRLKAQHQSVVRYLNSVPVPRMELNQIKELINRALSEQSIIEFNNDVIDSIGIMSGGFPHQAHLLSEGLYDLAASSVINNTSTRHCRLSMLEQVVRDLVVEVKNEEYLDVQRRLPSRLAESLLLKASEVQDEVIVAEKFEAFVDAESDDEKEKVRSALTSLSVEGFLEQIGHFGYKFVDPLFRIRLKLIQFEQSWNSVKTKINFNYTNEAKRSSHGSSEAWTPAEKEKLEEALWDAIADRYGS